MTVMCAWVAALLKQHLIKNYSMAYNLKDQTLALSGVLQAAVLVDKLARDGTVDHHEIETATNAIFNTNPSSTLDVYGSVQNMRTGLHSLRTMLNKEGKGVSAEVVRYGMSILHIGHKIRKNNKLLESLGAGIDKAKNQADYFKDQNHESVIGSLANAYLENISKLNFRVQVTGNPTFLQDDKIASKVRALLLFGIRSAMLWQQIGGHRWHFLFKRGAIVKAARELQTQGLH